VKCLSELPKEEKIAHLKRVRRTTHHRSDGVTGKNSSQSSKKQKTDGVTLEVVLGVANDITKEVLNKIIETYSLELKTRLLPGRFAESKQELEEWNGIWPTVYFHNRSEEHLQKELELSSEEVDQMKIGMEQAILDAEEAKDQGFVVDGGAVILCPKTGKVIARANRERMKRHLGPDSASGNFNSLCTSPILAIQGVSRIERMAALGHGMNSDTFKQGQYLCTAYDCYLTREPGVFEAMALVHSRIRRVIFGVENHGDGGLGGTGLETAVHALPGTNHHYRAFKCSSDSVLLKTCQQQYNT
jgi:tRNA-specific adenosine deaminase 3